MISARRKASKIINSISYKPIKGVGLLPLLATGLQMLEMSTSIRELIAFVSLHKVKDH